MRVTSIVVVVSLAASVVWGGSARERPTYAEGIVLPGGGAHLKEALEPPFNLGQLQIGARLPDGIVLPAVEGPPVDVSEAVSKGPTAIVFFRTNTCHYCHRQFAQAIEVHEKVRAKGYQLLLISPKNVRLNRSIAFGIAQKSDQKAPFPVLSDAEGKLGQAIGIGPFGPDDLETNWYPDVNDGGAYGPAMYVFGRDGRVKYQWYWRHHRIRFDGAGILAAVDYAEDPASEIPSDLSAALKNPAGVTRLNLSYQGLTELPAAIARLTDLEDLRLNGNALVALPPEIGALTALKRLEVAANELTELPPEIGSLTALERLDLVRNRIRTLPATVGRLTKLKHLNLMYNPFETLPPEIGKCVDLRALRFCGHRMKELPPEIGNLTELQVLFAPGSLDENGEPVGLEALPDEICKLKKLLSLVLVYNRLAALPENIGDLTALAECHLGWNRLTAVPDSFTGLVRLGTRYTAESVHLEHNRLTRLPEAIGDLRCMWMHLNDNQLTELPDSITRVPFIGLWVQNNRLTRLPETGWTAHATLRINASGNLITSIPDELLTLSGSSWLRLKDNPIPPQERERVLKAVEKNKRLYTF